MTLITLDPTGVKEVGLNTIAPRLATLSGKRVGLLHNVKVNARELLVDMGTVLQERYDVTLLPPLLTDAPGGMLASPAQLQQLAKEADLVLTGLGD
jgi:hypothetical protein